MLIDSNSNPYKKLLEAEDQFFDFPSDDLSFNIQYSDYKKDLPFYEKEKSINSKYPEFEEEDGVGIVEFMSEAVGEFFKLLGEKYESAYENDDSYYEANSDFSYSYLDREKKSDVDRKIRDFLEEEFSNSRIINLSDLIYKYMDDSDIYSDIKLDLDYSTANLFLTRIHGAEYENYVELEDKDTVEVEGYDFSLSELKDYLEDAELLELVLDYKNNIYLKDVYDEKGDKINREFIDKLKNYVLRNRIIREFMLMGGNEYVVVINKDELKNSFQSYIEDRDDIEYSIFQSEDNSVWEEEEEE